MGLSWEDFHSRCRPARHLIRERVASHVKKRSAADFEFLRSNENSPYPCDPDNTLWLVIARSENRSHRSPLIPRVALAGFAMEVMRYWASTLIS